jgi:putative ABC transport system permease protein
MLIASHIQTAIKQLLANKGKSFLTMLGIIMGIGSVIMIMTLGEIAKQFLLGQISQFGTNVVEVGVTGDLGPFEQQDAIYFTLEDIKALQASSLLDDMTGISSTYTLGSTLDYEGETHSVSVWGDTEFAFSVNNLDVVSGRLFDAAAVERGDRVIVLSQRFSEDLFETPDQAVGKKVRIDGAAFTVLGVVTDLPSVGGPFGGNYVYIPLSTVYQYLAPSEDMNKITFIFVEFDETADPQNFQNRLVYEIKRIKNIDQNDDDKFFVANREQFLDIFDNVLLGIQLFVAAIAGISLVVGGIGIMNIMLVTVRERTKEIGLRKAVGAKNRSILAQFLIEAVVLTTVGGVIGIIMSLSVCFVAVLAVNVIQPDWGVEFVIVPSAIIIACAVSMTTGLVFGLYPAVKAARLHPIEALRYE